MVETIKNMKYIFVLVVLSYFFFMFGNGILGFTNPDEVFYAQTAKEMTKHSSWLVPYLFDAPNFEKPIFLYWLLRLSFILFGVSSFSARFFPAVFATVGVIAVYYLGLFGFGNSRKAFYSALVLLSSGLYIGLARTVFTDMVFSVWILLALCFFIWGYLRRKNKALSLILFFVCCAFAVLTKGPLGIIIPFLIVIIFLSFRREVLYLCCSYTIWGMFIFIIIAFPWYMYMLTKFKNAFIQEFFYNDHIRRFLEAEHTANDTWYFYPFSIVACMFPWSIFVPVSLFSLAKRHLRQDEPFYWFLICWVMVVFVTFQTAHSKLVSYIFSLFPALALLIGDFLYDIFINRKNKFSNLLFLFTWCILVLFPIALIVALIFYSEKLSFKIPLYLIIFFFFFLLTVMLYFILRHRFVKVFGFLVFLWLPILFTVPFIKTDIEPYISSKAAGEYLLNNINPDSVILCAKPFLRGIRYYTDRKITALGSNFFSPHPITFLDSDEKVKNFLYSQAVTYCVLNKSTLEDIKRISQGEFKVTILKIIGNEYILKIQPLNNLNR